MFYFLKQLLKKSNFLPNGTVRYYISWQNFFISLKKDMQYTKFTNHKSELKVYITLMVLLQQLEANLAKVWASSKTTAGTTKTITCRSKSPCHLLDEFNIMPTKQLGTAVYDNFAPFSEELILEKRSCSITEYNNFFFSCSSFNISSFNTGSTQVLRALLILLHMLRI